MDTFQIKKRTTFGFSAENPTGCRNGGSHGKPWEKLNAYLRVEPGETVTLVDTDGPGMLTHFWIGGHHTRGFILRIYWDNNPFPSVEAPLSSFFGYGYDENLYDRDGKHITLNSSRILLAPCHGYNCYWEMPFRKHCRVTLENRDYETLLTFYMITGWHGEIPEDAGYFHAAYRREHPVTKGETYVAIDNIQGCGRFAGITLAVGLNGHSSCWVEGEAKMYIDGDEYPTLNYTALEDYFCGSFNFGMDAGIREYQTYNGLYCGMYAVIGNTKEMYNNQQRFLLYRWHDPDPIYFEKSFKFTLDDLGSTGARYDDFSSVTYWYLTEPAKLPVVLPPHKELEERQWAHHKAIKAAVNRAMAQADAFLKECTEKNETLIILRALERVKELNQTRDMDSLEAAAENLQTLLRTIHNNQ